MSKRLLILSGKGGTGKTTTAAAMIRFCHAKAFGDCDVDAPNLHLVTEVSSQPEKTAYEGAEKAQIDPNLCTGCGLCGDHCRFRAIQRIADGTCQVSPMACEGCGVCVQVCPAGAVALQPDVAGHLELYRGEQTFSTARLRMGRGNSGRLVSEVKKNLFKAAPEAELTVIDGAPGIGCPVISSVSGVDLALLVAEPSLSGRSDLERLLHTAGTLRVPVAVCVNQWDLAPDQTEALEEFCRSQGVPLVGRIPYDPAAPAAVNAGKSLAEVDCPAGRALQEICRRTMELLEIQ